MHFDSIIYSSDFLRTHSDIRILTREVSRGTLHKLRRGAYIPVDVWASADDREKHLIRIAATMSGVRSNLAVAGMSAAAVWGMPVIALPDSVTLLDSWRGGGRSEPGVRRTSAGFVRARTVVMNGFLATDLAWTALHVARVNTFRESVGSLDWAMRMTGVHSVTKSALMADLRSLPLSFGTRHIERVVEFSCDQSDSFGESMARACIFELGFLMPELQVGFHDQHGDMFADFCWRALGVIGEFDGKSKYTRNEYTQGDPSRVVWREKLREDRLRALDLRVVRFTFADIARPSLLARKLINVGIPRIH